MPCISVLLKCLSLPLPSGMALCSLELSRPGSPWVGDHILGSSTSWRFPAGWVGSSHHPDSCFLMFLGVLRVSCLFLLFGSLHDIISSLVLDKFYPKVNGTSEDTLKLPEVEAFLVSLLLYPQGPSSSGVISETASKSLNTRNEYPQGRHAEPRGLHERSRFPLVYHC